MMGELVFVLRCGLEEQAARCEVRAASVLWVTECPPGLCCFINFCTGI